MKCIDCANLKVEIDNWCVAWNAHIKVVDVDLPCKYFKAKTMEGTTSVEALVRNKLGRFRRFEPKSDFDLGFLGPRWISKYIVESLRMVGDMSMAYDLLLGDASQNLLRRLHIESGSR